MRQQGKAGGSRPKRARPRNEKHIIGFLFAICAGLSVVLGGLLGFQELLGMPDVRTVASYRPPQATLFYDRDGAVVHRLYSEHRVVVPLNRMHPMVAKAFVAAEDSRFYEHPGLDGWSVLRALINNIRSGRKSQGGSTITQQVAKGLLLTPEKTYIRKFKEAILAWRIDTLLSKDEIVYIYLNHIYLGSGAYGVEAAAQTYFGRSAADLNLAQIAMLAGLPQAPSRYSPHTNFDKARERQRYVLNRMVEDGYITDEQARAAYGNPPTLKSKDESRVNGYYISEAVKRAEEMIRQPFTRAGLRIYLNLDQTQQERAGSALTHGIAALSSRHTDSGDPAQGAVISIETCSGRVRALVGGLDYGKSPFNRAVQARRPVGSVIKPLLYSAAMERGWRTDSMIEDKPFGVAGGNGATWRPKNYDNRYHGRVTLADALVYSYNVPAVRTLQSIGIAPLHSLLRECSIQAELPHNLTIALGSADLSLLEISGAYLPFSCEGEFVQPTLIDRITTASGEELYRRTPRPRRVMSAASAQTMQELLVQVIERGTGKKAAGLPGTTGGKTGTTNANRDAWFIGFGGSHLAGVWIGHDQNQSLGPGENGGTTAAPIWREFMSEIPGE